MKSILKYIVLLAGILLSFVELAGTATSQDESIDAYDDSEVQDDSDGESQTPEIHAENDLNTENLLIIEDGQIIEESQGERVYLEDKGFSIIPPEGWMVRRDMVGTSLLMEPPEEVALVDQFKESIQIFTINEPKYIDETTAQEFKDWLSVKIKKTYPDIEKFAFIENIKVNTLEDREAMLFYDEFWKADVHLMQAQVLFSAEDRHYIATYTDLAENFSDEKREEYLDKAWKSIISIELDSRTPYRYDFIYRYVAPVVFLFLFLFLGSVLIRKRAGRKYSSMLLEDSGESSDFGQDEADHHQPSQVSDVSSFDSVPELKAFKKIKTKKPESKPPAPPSIPDTSASISPTKISGVSQFASEVSKVSEVSRAADDEAVSEIHSEHEDEWNLDDHDKAG